MRDRVTQGPTHLDYPLWVDIENHIAVWVKVYGRTIEDASCALGLMSNVIHKSPYLVPFNGGEIRLSGYALT